MPLSGRTSVIVSKRGSAGSTLNVFFTAAAAPSPPPPPPPVAPSSNSKDNSLSQDTSLGEILTFIKFSLITLNDVPSNLPNNVFNKVLNNVALISEP